MMPSLLPFLPRAAGTSPSRRPPPAARSLAIVVTSGAASPSQPYQSQWWSKATVPKRVTVVCSPGLVGPPASQPPTKNNPTREGKRGRFRLGHQ